MWSIMIATEFTKRERDLLIGALDNEQERYERTTHWLFLHIRTYDAVYPSKIRLFQWISKKILLLDVDDDDEHHSLSS
jgi:hypothetical protein